MRVEINRAGKFGTLCGKFWCKTLLIRYMSIMTFLDTEMAFCLWLPCSALRLNSKILNFSNNHFGHLTSRVSDSNRNSWRSNIEYYSIKYSNNSNSSNIYTISRKNSSFSRIWPISRFFLTFRLREILEILDRAYLGNNQMD